MTRLIVHIGAPKTGTTAVQKFLFRNRGALAQQGVLYPAGGMLNGAHHLIGAAIFPGRVNRLKGVRQDEVMARAVDEIRQEIASRNPGTVVLSTEYLWGELSSANIRRLLDPFRDMTLEVVAYLRRQDLFAQSLYVQAVKGGYASSFADWIKMVPSSAKGGFNLHRVLAAWRDCGLDVRVIARVYEKDQLNGDVCADFVAAVCPQAKVTLAESRKVVNSAPDTATIEILRRVNAICADKEVAQHLRREISAVSPPRSPFAPLTYLPPGDAESFLEQFAASNEKVAREFLKRDDGVLFRDPLPGSSGAVADDVSERALLDRLLSLLPAMLAPRAARHTPPPEAAPAPAARPAAAADPQRRKKRKRDAPPAHAAGL